MNSETLLKVRDQLQQQLDAINAKITPIIQANEQLERSSVAESTISTMHRNRMTEENARVSGDDLRASMFVVGNSERNSEKIVRAQQKLRIELDSYQAQKLQLIQKIKSLEILEAKQRQIDIIKSRRKSQAELDEFVAQRHRG